MKEIRILLITVLSLNCFAFIKAQNYLPSNGSNSLIKSISIIESNEFLGDDESVKLKEGLNANKYRRNEYDRKGNVIKKSEYNIEGILYQITVYKYDTESKMIEKITYDPDSIHTYRSSFGYNNKENMIESYYYINSELAYRGTYKYDDMGNEIENLQFDGDASIASEKWTCKYDDAGNMIEELLDGVESYRKVYKYDKEGNVIEMSESGNMGQSYRDYTIQKTFSYKLDEEGNIVEKITYNSDNNIVSSSLYDEMGNEIERKRYSSDQLVESYTTKYTYDQKQNWTKIIFYYNDVLQNIRVRTFEYYK